MSRELCFWVSHPQFRFKMTALSVFDQCYLTDVSLSSQMPGVPSPLWQNPVFMLFPTCPSWFSIGCYFQMTSSKFAIWPSTGFLSTSTKKYLSSIFFFRPTGQQQQHKKSNNNSNHHHSIKQQQHHYLCGSHSYITSLQQLQPSSLNKTTTTSLSLWFSFLHCFIVINHCTVCCRFWGAAYR
jgi:hypothetical protein